MTPPPGGRAPPSAYELTPTQIQGIVTVERIHGSISLVAVFFIFVTYGLVRRVRNVQNTFIVFASISNVGASIACIIALDGLKMGERSALCQTQAFFFQMFMQSDPWWSLAMAINVFLVFYFRTSPDSFRRWWWVYCLICYGGPLISGLSLLFIRNPSKGPIYGNAVIWCWVDGKYADVRIYTYYLVILLCIAGTILCYALVGYQVFRTRNRLQNFSASTSRETGHTEHAPNSDFTHTEAYWGTVTTEVRVTHTSVGNLVHPKDTDVGRRRDHATFPDPDQQPSIAQAEFVSSVSATPRRRTMISNPMTGVVKVTKSVVSKFSVEDPVKRAYLRTSVLFGLSVLITWIPSSMNRIHAWLRGFSPFTYQAAAAAVLPLQGFWNFVIFFATSWRIVKDDFMYRTGRVPHRSCETSGLGTLERTANRDEHRTLTNYEAESLAARSDVELQTVQEEPEERKSG